MPQLDFSTYLGQMFWLFLIFGVLYYTLSSFFLPSIRDVIRTRKSRIENDIKQAEDAKSRALSAQNESDDHVIASKERALALITDAAAKAKEHYDACFLELGKKLDITLAEADEKIAEMRTDALKEVETLASDISNDIIKKLNQVA